MQTSLEQITAVLETESAERPVWVRVGKLFDGETVLTDAHLVYDALKIRHVGRGGKLPAAELLRPGQTEPDLHLPDVTVLPGLIEAHAHLFLDGDPVDFAVRKEYLTNPSDRLLDKARQRWPSLLETGVMAVRDAGDNDGVGLRLAAECAECRGAISTTGYIDSPGAAIHHKGRYGSFMSRPSEEFPGPAECVGGRVKEGADRIKLIATGIINFKKGAVTAPPQMSTDEVRSFVEAAKRQGRQTFAHASGTEGVENVIAGGVNTVEHGYFITEDQLARLRDLEMGWVPTLAPVAIQADRADEIGWDKEIVSKLERIVSDHKTLLAKANDRGVRVIAGSDAGSCGVPHGRGFLRELELMQDAGLSAVDVLRSATGTPAALLAFQEPIGRIAPGCRSRMIYSLHHPLDRVTDLQREKLVLLDGKRAS
jgi:imidazolonepropionase-like amidohydrolase